MHILELGDKLNINIKGDWQPEAECFSYTVLTNCCFGIISFH